MASNELEYAVIVNKQTKYLNNKEFEIIKKANHSNNMHFMANFNESLIKNTYRKNAYSISNPSTQILFYKLANSGLKNTPNRKRFQPETMLVLQNSGIEIFNNSYSINFATIINVSEDEKVYILSNNVKDFFLKSLLNSKSGFIQSYSSFWVDIYDELLSFARGIETCKTIDDINSRSHHTYFLTKDKEVFYSKITVLLNDENDNLRNVQTTKTRKEEELYSYFENISPIRDFENYLTSEGLDDSSPCFLYYLQHISNNF